MPDELMGPQVLPRPAVASSSRLATEPPRTPADVEIDTVPVQVKHLGNPDRKIEVQQHEPLTTEELQDYLHKLNLTFDLFEIAAEFRIDEDDNSVHVTLHNTRTGEVIRRIPPEEFQLNFMNFKNGVGLLFNRFY